MKRIAACFFVLCLLLSVCSAHADRYILHSPGRGQLKSEEAVAIAKEYLLSLCPALQDSHLPEARPFSKEYLFGPGWQWDTEDDVWVLLMPDAYAVVHGTTGEMLDWRLTYPTQENWYVRYENVMPEKMDHTAAIERAIQIAEERAGDGICCMPTHFFLTKRIGGYPSRRTEQSSPIRSRYGRSICLITLRERIKPVSWQDICWMRMETSWQNGILKPEFLSKIIFGLRTNNDEGRWYGHF